MKDALLQYETTLSPLRASLHQQALNLTGSITEAEDLVQECLLRAYTRLNLLRPEVSPRAWLGAILKNLYINRYRKRAEPTISLRWEDLDGYRNAPSPSLPQPEQTVVRRMEAAAATRILRALPLPYREVAELGILRTATYEEIAAQLRLPLGTVRSRMARARALLQRKLADWNPTLS